MTDVMIVAVVLCIVFVQVFQTLGDVVAKRIDHRK